MQGMKSNPAGSTCQRAEGSHPRPQWALYPQVWGNRAGESGGGEWGRERDDERGRGPCVRMGSQGSRADWLG